MIDLKAYLYGKVKPIIEDWDTKNIYDENMRYVGKGPVGYYKLLTVVSDVARQFQTEGFILNKFGKIPIIVHALE